MNKYYAKWCTHPGCTSKNNVPVKRSLGWAYCLACYIDRFPAAAKRNGFVLPDRPATEEVLVEHNAQLEPSSYIQLSLFQEDL
jgi:Rieske Fe-S protein